MLMDIAAYICIVIVLSVMAAMKICSSHEKKRPLRESGGRHHTREGQDYSNHRSDIKGGQK